eukprot:scaffold21649_cov38-Phaeocystis_antarctica.AAC.2
MQAPPRPPAAATRSRPGRQPARCGRQLGAQSWTGHRTVLRVARPAARARRCPGAARLTAGVASSCRASAQNERLPGTSKHSAQANVQSASVRAAVQQALREAPAGRRGGGRDSV